MSRVLCLAQAHAAAKPSRAKSKRAASGEGPKPKSFTMLERLPVNLPAHKPVLDILRKHATQQTIVDDAHPKDALKAHVVLVDQLGSEAVMSIASALAERRAMALSAEKDFSGGDVLSKRLDRIFEQELEWLALRNLLAAALPRSPAAGGKARKTRARALVLIDA
jgi:hypothetical protein